MQIDRGDTTIGLAGDWHGNGGWTRRKLRQFARAGVRTVHQLGDFGIFIGAAQLGYIMEIERHCAFNDIHLWITPGNHEDWDYLDALFRVDGGAEPQYLVPRNAHGFQSDHIHVLPRGYRWHHAGRSFVSAGGAPSIDYQFRERGVDWWPNEQLPEEKANEIAAAGHAEIMLAHDMPDLDAAVLRDTLAPRVSVVGAWPAPALHYVAEGRRRLSIAYEGVRPKLLAHGHYHRSGDEQIPGGARVLSLDMDESAGNALTLDLTAADFGVNWLGD
ncbi:hypothetical protein [Microbacterium capsulatum]|uniref:Calcineurin-like phosphoesterase domain-containing protein n=1 Tax=Microbacterium capsulatum TaxID=3041921 RepID=A0ABU0XGQ2_9MICO|nr:hypothetical protein [Microbacterium sp. ASV81]MDQ4214072.1 hypothetical protein [Microbacterium sp. ASV81]